MKKHLTRACLESDDLKLDGFTWNLPTFSVSHRQLPFEKTVVVSKHKVLTRKFTMGGTFWSHSQAL